MIACSSCAQENPDVARFCLACGKSLAEAAQRKERRFVSVVFVDLVGFTGRAEKLDPEDVQAVLEPYRDAVRKELESFGGVVEKFIGDAIMAVFGAPTAFGDDAERAVRAALAVRDRVAAETFQLRIAVNTGEALVQIDARPALGEAMVAGDVVNTAARLQAAAAANTVVVGEETWRATRDAIEYERADPVVAKGKSDAVPAWVALRAATLAGERRLASTFVGRGRELAALGDIWQRVREQRTPHLVTIVADAGVGKTRLGVEFSEKIAELGGFTVRGRSLPYRDSSAYGAFASQLKQLCGIFESDAPDVAAAKLRATVGMLGAGAAEDVAQHLALLLGADATVTVADRETLFFSIRCFIEAVARDRPTVFVFEDLHWADDGLLDLVELLAQRLRDLPILLLVLARPELIDARPGWGGGLPAYTMLPLGPLSAEEAQQLAVERLSAQAVHALNDRAPEIALTAAGNPLFIEQLSASLAEATDADVASLPPTIRGLLAARLDALPQAERAVLLDAAVGGKVFWRGYLERVHERDDSIGDLLGALERRDLIRRETVSAIEGEQQFTFTHVLIRDVAYDLLPRAARRERHELCALFLEETTAEFGEAGAALARHWRDAGDHGKAFGYFFRAAAEADQGWAKERAVTFYREALDLAPDEEQRRQVRRRLALAQQARFHVEDAIALGLRRATP